MQPQPSLIRPALIFNLELTLTKQQGPPTPINQSLLVFVTNFFGELKLKTANGSAEVFAGQLKLKYPIPPLGVNRNSSASLIFELAPNDLRTIEKLREAKDLQLLVFGYLSAEFQAQPQTKTDSNFTLNIRLPKSDWVENFLPALGFKTVSLVEIPQILDSQFSEAVIQVDNAWKQYSMGDYRKVFADCRNAIECLAENVKSKGFEKQDVSDDGKSKPVPDWEKFFDNKELGDLVATINKKLYSD